MYGQMPQEIEVGYIIPALRREIAKIMIKEYNLTQKEVSGYMNLTEAAVSQYLNLKRAREVPFSQPILNEIKRSVKRILENNNLLVSEMIKLCNMLEVKQIMCNLHKKYNPKLDEYCDVCFENNLVKREVKNDRTNPRN